MVSFPFESTESDTGGDNYDFESVISVTPDGDDRFVAVHNSVDLGNIITDWREWSLLADTFAQRTVDFDITVTPEGFAELGEAVEEGVANSLVDALLASGAVSSETVAEALAADAVDGFSAPSPPGFSGFGSDIDGVPTDSTAAVAAHERIPALNIPWDNRLGPTPDPAELLPDDAPETVTIEFHVDPDVSMFGDVLTSPYEAVATHEIPVEAFIGFDNQQNGALDDYRSEVDIPEVHVFDWSDPSGFDMSRFSPDSAPPLWVELGLSDPTEQVPIDVSVAGESFSEVVGGEQDQLTTRVEFDLPTPLSDVDPANPPTLEITQGDGREVFAEALSFRLEELYDPQFVLSPDVSHIEDLVLEGLTLDNLGLDDPEDLTMDALLDDVDLEPGVAVENVGDAPGQYEVDPEWGGSIDSDSDLPVGKNRSHSFPFDADAVDAGETAVIVGNLETGADDDEIDIWNAVDAELPPLEEIIDNIDVDVQPRVVLSALDVISVSPEEVGVEATLRETRGAPGDVQFTSPDGDESVSFVGGDEASREFTFDPSGLGESVDLLDEDIIGLEAVDGGEVDVSESSVSFEFDEEPDPEPEPEPDPEPEPEPDPDEFPFDVTVTGFPEEVEVTESFEVDVVVENLTSEPQEAFLSGNVFDRNRVEEFDAGEERTFTEPVDASTPDFGNFDVAVLHEESDESYADEYGVDVVGDLFDDLPVPPEEFTPAEFATDGGQWNSIVRATPTESFKDDGRVWVEGVVTNVPVGIEGGVGFDGIEVYADDESLEDAAGEYLGVVEKPDGYDEGDDEDDGGDDDPFGGIDPTDPFGGIDPTDPVISLGSGDDDDGDDTSHQSVPDDTTITRVQNILEDF